MRKKILYIMTAIFGIILAGSARADIKISNVQVTYQNTSSDYAFITFDIEWDDSWRDDVNYDAVWIFAKYRNPTNVSWGHCKLYGETGVDPSLFDAGEDGDASGPGDYDEVQIVVPDDQNGCFIQRYENETGHLSRTGVRIVWNYAGLADSTVPNLSLRVFGIQMVYIPEGDFYAGDGASTGSYKTFRQAEDDADPWHIISENPIEVNNVPGRTYYYYSTEASYEDASGSTFTLVTGYPKGFQAFYMMKYEVSQGQYRDFLNTLSQSMQTNRVAAVLTNEDDAGTYVMVAEDTTTVNTRQSIKAGPNPRDGYPYTFGCDLNNNGVFNEPDDGEYLAMDFLSTLDGVAFADWAALRPLTELEFEKAARGSGVAPSASGEYAWGMTYTGPAISLLLNPGLANENPWGSIINDRDSVLSAPVRCGSFGSSVAKTDPSERYAYGAGYYGCMEMSGNVAEKYVNVGTVAGRAFRGSHGDGYLVTGSASYSGSATNSDWPGYSGIVSWGVAVGYGYGQRGGHFNTSSPASSFNSISSRRSAQVATSTTRYFQVGARAGRTAP